MTSFQISGWLSTLPDPTCRNGNRRPSPVVNTERSGQE
jgi:hypothetical protein